jgi:long-chain fatty acid transport protein
MSDSPICQQWGTRLPGLSILPVLLVASIMAWPVVEAQAGSAFELRTQSVTTLGSAQAGMTAGAADLTAMIFNPAALAYGTGTEFCVGATGFVNSVKFAETSATTVLGTPIPGTQGGNAGTTAGVPNLYVAMDISDNLRFGLAIAPRFGLGSFWSEGWVGRYYAVTSELTTIDVAPSMSYRFDKSLSFGLAVDAEYAKIKTTAAIDFGTIDQVLTGGAFGGIPAGSDGSTSSKADSWGVGAAVGMLYEPQSGTRFGIDYHSEIKQRLRGSATFNTGGVVGQSIAAATGAFTGSSVSSNLVLPAMASLGVYHEVNPDWTLLADIKWTGWHALQSIDVTFGNPAQPPVRTVLDWRDSWFAAAGARYRINDRVALRFGVAYDQTPTRDVTRTPQIPDSDSYWAAVGLEYRISPAVKLDFAYGHVFATDAPLNLLATGTDNAFRGNLSGTIKDSNVDYLAIQVVYKFR